MIQKKMLEPKIRNGRHVTGSSGRMTGNSRKNGEAPARNDEIFTSLGSPALVRGVMVWKGKAPPPRLAPGLGGGTPSHEGCGGPLPFPVTTVPDPSAKTT